MEPKLSLPARLSLALVIPGLILSPTSFASLAIYDATIAAEHGGGAGVLPYAAALTEEAVFDGSVATPFDFGSLTGPATIELIIEGDPVAGGQNGYIGQGANAGNSLRYEQWDDTGTLGFTRSGVADYDLGVPSPTEPTHIAYRWNGADTMELFVDGVLSGTVAGANFEMPSGAGLIGNVSDGGGEGMVGTIHRITTYDSALEDAAIVNHANAWLTNTDPSIQVVDSVELPLNGGIQSFDLTVFNTGQTQTLTISSVDIGGDDAAKFSIDTVLPISIPPGGESALEYTFAPAGASGTVAATFTINSNDPSNGAKLVALSGLIRDPQISVADALDFGETKVPVTLPLEVSNLGATQALTLSDYSITGAAAGKFDVSGPASIPANSSADVSVTFTPAGEVAAASAQLEITSDDPGQPSSLIALSAVEPLEDSFLTAYDSIIAADHGGGGGLLPYNTVLTSPETFDTTNSAAFDFGTVIGDATFEFILEGDPVGGGQDGYLAQGENTTFSLRFEQWNDTGQLGFTHAGVLDYVFAPTGDPALVNSPETPTHIAYRWESALQTMSLYVNGELAGNNAGSAIEMPTGFGVLGNNPGLTEGMLGTIYRVTIYDSDIGADNINRHALAFLTGAGADDFLIISFVYDEGAETATLIWNSTPGTTYAVDYSFDLNADWQELTDNVPSMGTTTEFTTPANLTQGQTRMFFQVRVP